MKYANKTVQYNVYNSDSGRPKFVGDTSSYKRPDIEYLTDTLKGSGILGELDIPTTGQIGSMEIELTFNKTNSEYVNLMSPKAHNVEIRWATDVLDSAKSSVEIEANKEIMTVIPKAGSLGNIESNETNEATTTYEVLYYNYIVNGKSVIEIDKLNMILKFNGIDYSEQLRNAL